MMCIWTNSCSAKWMRKKAKSYPKYETTDGISKNSDSLQLQFDTRFMLILLSFQLPLFGDYYGLTNSIDLIHAFWWSNTYWAKFGLEIIVLQTFLATSPVRDIMLLNNVVAFTSAAGHTVKCTSLHLYKTSSVKIVKSCLFSLLSSIILLYLQSQTNWSLNQNG
jgi:hypothetical protein